VKILGISLGHDSNACLVEDGKIVRYMAEERFNRLKVGVNSALESVRFCLGEHEMSEMDRVVVSSGIVGTLQSHYDLLLKFKTGLGRPLLFRDKGYQVDNVKQIPHHDCHAASAYYTSGLRDSLLISIDGIGDEITHYVAEGRDGKIKPLCMIRKDKYLRRGLDGVFREKAFKNLQAHSWGWFYGMVTEGLGWRMVCDEGKTMGLAPYGDPQKVPDLEFRKNMYAVFPSGYYHNDGRVYYTFGGSAGYQKMAHLYGRENVAAKAQKVLEEKVVGFIKRWMKRTGQRNLCTAGGLFLNVKLNQRIVEECGLDNYWPFPLAGDSGVSIGAALYEHHKTASEYKPERIEHLYWGNEYTNEEIKRVLDLAKLRYRPYVVQEVAEMLADNKIVAWFQGRMEGGPRALGGRSILMSPLRAENKDIINRDVKFREGFRPFCPSVAEEAHERYFQGGGDFMITACRVLSDQIPAVTHVDGTARPQVVRKRVNPKFHGLLDAFGAKTGHPVLLNTSFNVMGEPIIRTPQEALRCFFSVGLDALVIGDFVLEKTGGVK
jgi:carbamoyltransferase